MGLNKISEICFVGLTPPEAIARNAVLADGLSRLGIHLMVCVVGTSGPGKFRDLARRLGAEATESDLVLVGFTSSILVPPVKLLSRKPVVFNASHSLFEGMVEDRRAYSAGSARGIKCWLIDFFSFLFADLVLVESEAQKSYLHSKFFVSRKKMEVLHIGADDRIFYPDETVSKLPTFTVAFRGGLLPATGVETVLRAAELLRDEDMDFFIYGRGPAEQSLKSYASSRALSRVHFVTEFLQPDELHAALLRSHVLLGNFSSHLRLERTIQNKVFEALALGMPFITRDSPSNREVLEDDVDCLFVPASDPEALADGIKRLRADPALCERIGRAALQHFRESGSPEAIGRRFVDIMRVHFVSPGNR